VAARKKWRRPDFVDSAAFQAWKAKGTPVAKPFERAGFATDYQYRKARKAFKAYTHNNPKNFPMPPVQKLRRVVTQQQRSAKAGRIDRSIIVERKASGKSKRFTVFVAVFASNGQFRIFGIRFPRQPTVKTVIREAKKRALDPELWNAHYGQKSDPFDEEIEIMSIEILSVVKPGVRRS
jgi:hypothetical protein